MGSGLNVALLKSPSHRFFSTLSNNFPFSLISVGHFNGVIIWSFRSFKGILLSLSVIYWRSGVPIEGEQGGEGQPFRGWKGQVFPACEPRKGHFEGMEAKGQLCSLIKDKKSFIINRLQKYPQ